jgi:hypothetical protein
MYEDRLRATGCAKLPGWVERCVDRHDDGNRNVTGLPIWLRNRAEAIDRLDPFG